jgi:hypothetical protein
VELICPERRVLAVHWPDTVETETTAPESWLDAVTEPDTDEVLEIVPVRYGLVTTIESAPETVEVDDETPVSRAFALRLP